MAKAWRRRRFVFEVVKKSAVVLRYFDVILRIFDVYLRILNEQKIFANTCFMIWRLNEIEDKIVTSQIAVTKTAK